jgi:hypothetical protein
VGLVTAPQRISRFAFQRFLNDQPRRQSQQLRTLILYLAAALDQRPQLLACPLGCVARIKTLADPGKNFGLVTWTGEIQPTAESPTRYYLIEAARSGIRLSPRRLPGLGPSSPRVTDCHLSVTFLVYAKRSAIKQRREEYDR